MHAPSEDARLEWFACQFLFDFPREGDEYLRSVGKATRGDRPPAKVTFLAHGRQLNMAKAFMSKDAREEGIVLEHAH